MSGGKQHKIRWVHCAISLIVGCISSSALAQTAEEFRLAKERVELEPNVNQTVRAALAYFRVSPEEVDSLRDKARARGTLPLLAAGYRFDDDAQSKLGHQEGSSTFDSSDNTDRLVNSFTIGAVWDLREIMMNPAEIQAYGLVGVQRDIMLEVARAYYLRRQIFLRLLLRPSEDPLANLANQIRVDELTAILDVLTDGYFSEESRRMLEEHKRRKQRLRMAAERARKKAEQDRILDRPRSQMPGSTPNRGVTERPPGLGR